MDLANDEPFIMTVDDICYLDKGKCLIHKLSDKTLQKVVFDDDYVWNKNTLFYYQKHG